MMLVTCPSLSAFSYEREIPSMSKAKSLKNGNDVSAFFQDIPVRRISIRRINNAQSIRINGSL